MANGAHRVTELFEQEIARYTRAPYAVAVDNQSNALFLALMREGVKGREITIPARTYPSVPCEILHAGARVRFRPVQGRTLKGAYRLEGSNVWDSALRFTAGMYLEHKPYSGALVCLSFTGPHKHLKLGKGGAILTDDYEAFLWFKRARYSGRRECSYHDDHFDMLGWNFYMMPEVAARGLLLMPQFYHLDGTPRQMEDIELPYPDLSTFEVYTR